MNMPMSFEYHFKGKSLILVPTLFVKITELSNWIRELYYWIRYFFNTIRELFNSISELSNYTYIESSQIDLKSP